MTEIDKKEELHLILKKMDVALTEVRAGMNALISMGLFSEAPKQLSKLKPMANPPIEVNEFVIPTREEVAILVSRFLEAKGGLPMLELREKYGFNNITSLLLKSPEVIEKVIAEFKNV